MKRYKVVVITLLLMCTLFANAGLSKVQPAFAATGLAGHWNFDEGTGTTANDSSGNTHTGTLQGDASWGPGYVGASSLAVHGSTGYMDAGAPVVDTSKSFSIAAWVKLNHNNGFRTFVSVDGSNVSAFYLQLRGDTGKFAFARLASDQTTAATAIAASNNSPTVGIWYHLVGVYDATAQLISLYVNGVLQQSVVYTSPWAGAGHLVVGRGKYGGNPVDFADGQIDDVYAYSSVLAAGDIAALPGSPTAGPTLTVQAGQKGASVNPGMFGLMFEDISHSGDGGVYAELIRNRIFKDDPNTPVNWSLVNSTGAAGSIALDSTHQANQVALTTSLKLQATQVTTGQRVGVANTGYFGIPVTANTTYKASFYAQASSDFTGPITLDIESNDGSTVFATATVSAITTGWQKYEATLVTGGVPSSENNRFVVSIGNTGTVWLNLVSLFPPTWHDRENGNRVDIMHLLDAIKPGFLRFPGGNFLEGQTLSDYFNWKNTIHKLAQRPGHNDPWGYRSTDGLGLLEYLEWCEGQHMTPLLAVYAGFALNNTHLTPGTAAFNTIVQDALDEIQYITGDTTTTWGAIRAADGHAASFPLQYVEIGNEDFFDHSGSYSARYAAFYNAIHAAYPNLKMIATAGVTGTPVDVYDDHYYRSAQDFENDVYHYDSYNRSGPKIFVGEYATQEGNPTPDMNGALGDASWMTGLERNGDVVNLASYAPLLANVNAVNWGTNLIAYDALHSYASPSYYVQQMFSLYHGDTVLPSYVSGAQGLYYVVSKVASTGVTYVKVVNTTGSAENTNIVLNGITTISTRGTAEVLSSASPTDTNTLSNPTKIAPVTNGISNLKSTFTYSFAPYSVTVLQFTVS